LTNRTTDGDPVTTTVPPIIAACDAVTAAYTAARDLGVAPPVEPALMVAAHTRIADALDARVELCEAELISDVQLGHGVTMALVLVDPVKFWALQRSIGADQRDSKSARDLADWWGKQPSPRRRRTSAGGR
jgi:transposase